MSDELININLVIADRPYPLKIKPSEEELVRKAAKELNNKVKEYQKVYAAKDKQDYLAMTALMYAVDSLGNKSKTTIEDNNFDDKLNELNQLLEAYQL